MQFKLFEKKNYVLFGLSLLLLVVGYILLAQGPADNHLSKSVAPLILIGTYCGLIPYAIFSGIRVQEAKDQKKKSGV